MSTIKPISVFELKQYTDKLQISNKIIEFINNRLKYNAMNFGFIGACIPFSALLTDSNEYINHNLTLKLKDIFTEFKITQDHNCIYLHSK